MAGVLVVKTPFHYLNAIEALRSYGSTPEDCILCIISGAKEKSDVVKKIASDLPWGAIKVLKRPPARKGRSILARVLERYDKMFAVFKLNILTLFWPTAQVAFTPLPYISFVRHLLNRMKCEHLVVTDEGIAQPWILEVLAQKYNSVYVAGGLLEWLRILTRYDDNQISTYDIFTAYDISESNGTSVRRHTFQYVKSMYAVEQTVAADVILLLGAPANCYATNLQEYINLLRKIIALCPLGITKVLYAPHRMEHRVDIDKICSALGLDLFNASGYPIEMTLLRHSYVPFCVAGFASSAIESLRLIYAKEIQYFVVLYAETKSGEEVDAMEKAYEYLLNLSDERVVVYSIDK